MSNQPTSDHACHVPCDYCGRGEFPEFQTAAESARQSAARRDEIAEQLTERYGDYVIACEIEECEPHSFHMWQIHGMMEGPL